MKQRNGTLQCSTVVMSNSPPGSSTYRMFVSVTPSTHSSGIMTTGAAEEEVVNAGAVWCPDVSWADDGDSRAELLVKSATTSWLLRGLCVVSAG